MITSRTLDYLYSQQQQYGSVSALSLYFHECKTDGVSHACARASCFGRMRRERQVASASLSPRLHAQNNGVHTLLLRRGTAELHVGPLAPSTRIMRFNQRSGRSHTERRNRQKSSLVTEREVVWPWHGCANTGSSQSAFVLHAPAGAPEMEDVSQDRRNIGGAAAEAVDPMDELYADGSGASGMVADVLVARHSARSASESRGVCLMRRRQCRRGANAVCSSLQQQQRDRSKRLHTRH
jgi:hypothetical protein